ncbi:MAG TPA: helix-turn-helix domain-containing protein [Sphingomonadaceae bacterium]|nr:helix-turn-helix domain-containing protein [Sphingomonadaceae bacterium]
MESLHGRWYQDACGTAFALEIIGERWSLLVVRELMLGGLRFSDIKRALPGISSKVLAERLAGLETAGVLVKREAPPPTSATIYELTEWGYHAEPAIQELGRWAARSACHDPSLPLSPVSLMISLRTMIDHRAAQELEADIGFEVAGQTFRARLSKGIMPIGRGVLDGAQAVFRAQTAAPIAAFFYRKLPPQEIEGLELEGDLQLATRFGGLFSLPPRIDTRPSAAE